MTSDSTPSAASAAKKGGQRRCRTLTYPRKIVAENERRGAQGRDFWHGAPSLEHAVTSYCAFHESVTSAGSLQDDVRYLIYTPSFHGEGWGNRVMALVAVAALAVSTGRVLLIDWNSSWALEDYVSLPPGCRATSLGWSRVGRGVE
jgi:hypothetical protein